MGRKEKKFWKLTRRLNAPPSLPFKMCMTLKLNDKMYSVMVVIASIFKNLAMCLVNAN